MGSGLAARHLAVGAVSPQLTASDRAYAWLVSRMTPTGLVDSYEDNHEIAYLYDQAVAAIAFLAKHDLTRARYVLEALRALQYPDGSWNTAYYCSTCGIQEPQKHVGPVLWVALAVAHYERMTGDTQAFHRMAECALDWSLTFKQDDGGINGGIDRDGSLVPWCSTEHNEDAYAALTYFCRHDDALAVKSYLDTQCWDSSARRFLGGRNDPADPMDVNSWGVIALGARGAHPYADSLDYVLQHHRNTQTVRARGTTLDIDGFDFNSDRNDIWFEGQGEMALAFKTVGRVEEANHFIDEIIKMQDLDGGTGVRYSLRGSHNGYWQMQSAKSVSGSGWLIFAIHDVNPFRP